jgi:hypothetical protein
LPLATERHPPFGPKTLHNCIFLGFASVALVLSDLVSHFFFLFEFSYSVKLEIYALLFFSLQLSKTLVKVINSLHASLS